MHAKFFYLYLSFIFFLPCNIILQAALQYAIQYRSRLDNIIRILNKVYPSFLLSHYSLSFFIQDGTPTTESSRYLDLLTHFPIT